MEVVFDTNVLISTILFKKRLAPLYDLIERDGVALAFTKATLHELRRVLAREKFIGILEQKEVSAHELVDALLQHARLYPETEVENVIKEDPSDNKFLACALAAQADFIVSGDKHLLRLKDFHEMPIVTARQFLRRISRKKRER